MFSRVRVDVLSTCGESDRLEAHIRAERKPGRHGCQCPCLEMDGVCIFSKQARQFSVLQSLGISPTVTCSMSRADIEAFRSVMLSDYPEEELLGLLVGLSSRGMPH